MQAAEERLRIGTDAAQRKLAVLDALKDKRPEADIRDLAEQAIAAQLAFARERETPLDKQIESLQWCMEIHDEVGLGPHMRDVMADVAVRGRDAYFLQATGTRLRTVNGKLGCWPGPCKTPEGVDLLAYFRAEAMHRRACSEFGVSSSIDSTKGLLDIVYEPEDLDYVSPDSMYYSDAPLHQSELVQLRHSDGRFPWPCPSAFAEVSKYFDEMG